MGGPNCRHLFTAFSVSSSITFKVNDGLLEKSQNGSNVTSLPPSTLKLNNIIDYQKSIGHIIIKRMSPF